MRARSVAASNLHLLSAAFFSPTRLQRAHDATHRGSRISKSDVGKQKHGKKKLFINDRIILPEFIVIYTDHDLIWRVEIWITIKDCDKRQLPGKCVVVCICVSLVTRLWQLNFSATFTDGQSPTLWQESSRKKKRGSSWRQIEPCDWMESGANWWSETQTSDWWKNEYDMKSPNMRLARTMSCYPTRLKFRLWFSWVLLTGFQTTAHVTGLRDIPKLKTPPIINYLELWILILGTCLHSCRNKLQGVVLCALVSIKF